jgi:hypothetical protein
MRRVPAPLGAASPSDIRFVAGGHRSLAANSSQVFFMSFTGTLWYTEPGSGSGTELVRDQAAPSAIAVDDAAVFWATGSDTAQAVLYAQSLAGGAPSKIATGVDHPDALAIDEANVYVTARGTPPSYTNGAILRVPRTGGPIEHLIDNVVDPHEIVVSGSFVLYTSRGTMTDAGYVGGTIYRLAK